MLFQKDIEPRCAYCQRGTPVEDGKLICVRQGIVSAAGSCRLFRYDPLKRIPPKPITAAFDKFKDEDFSL